MCQASTAAKVGWEVQVFHWSLMKAQCLFYNGPKMGTFQHNTIHLFTGYAQKTERQYKLHLQCTVTGLSHNPEKSTLGSRCWFTAIWTCSNNFTLLTLFKYIPSHPFTVIRTWRLLIASKIDLKNRLKISWRRVRKNTMVSGVTLPLVSLVIFTTKMFYIN